MRILLTGGFGNIGQAVITEAAKLNHEILVFEINNGKNRRLARKYRNEIAGIIFGDIQNSSSVRKALKKCDAIIHLAAILPPGANRNRDSSMAVNYQGTVNLVEAIKSEECSIPLVVASSVSVMGPTQKNNRLVSPEDPVVPTDYYSESKIVMEKYLMEHYHEYIVFRVAGVMPTFNNFSLGFLGEMFNLHPEGRMEMIIDQDVAVGLIHGIDHLIENGPVKKRTFILGGGSENGYQLLVKDFMKNLFNAVGFPVPDKKFFAPDLTTQYTDWYDTDEAQRLFDYQHHTLDFYLDHLKQTYGKYRIFIKLFNKILLRKIVSYSPYY